ncbi:DUF4917 family protein [Brucella gallinifaecis]|uniref:DUF4917 family protein n=1 Tax=Brucella gallinifaecis TaxID=215590 RepID=UPI002362CAD2|nr:DUF4917 family protein [Brucella gallinifaecis]
MAYLMRFADAIADSNQFSKRHLLIGNRFSIACCPDIFHYGSLFSAADFSNNPELVKVFEVLGTQDFEVAIKNLEAGALLAGIYTLAHTDAAAKMLSDANALKEILFTAIVGNRPDVPGDIPRDKFWAGRRFLNLFLGRVTMVSFSPSTTICCCIGPSCMRTAHLWRRLTSPQTTALGTTKMIQ